MSALILLEPRVHQRSSRAQVAVPGHVDGLWNARGVNIPTPELSPKENKFCWGLPEMRIKQSVRHPAVENLTTLIVELLVEGKRVAEAAREERMAEPRSCVHQP